MDIFVAVGVVYLVISIVKNPQAGLVIAINVLIIAINLIGIVWGCNEIFGGFVIEINAISVVNLITAIGLAVEFCVHIMLYYMNSTGNR